MRFMMFVCSDAEPDAMAEKPGEIEAWCDDVDGRGKQITDGPFTESKEVIVGFDILECESMDEAVEIAARHPMARAGRLEVRAFWPFEG